MYPVDLIASMYQLLGIDPQTKLPHPQGADARVIPTTAEAVSSGGLLKEIL